MNDVLVSFKSMKWQNPAPGIRYKEYIKDNQRIRLVEFSEDFVEQDWCTKGHIGYILEGSISIDFNGRLITFKSGDGVFIPEGEGDRHKGKVAKGERVLIILFEDNRV